MSKYKWEMRLSIYFITISGIIYYIDYMIFRRPNAILDNFILQVAFLPIYVLLATVIIDQLLNRREKSERLKKLNMVIGAFFSEMGNELLNKFIDYDANSKELSQDMKLTAAWNDREFKDAEKNMKNYNCRIEISEEGLNELKGFLLEKRIFLMTMISNPNLMEHESFTELLWAVFHLSDELTQRKDVMSLSQKAMEHLNLDIKRAYLIIIEEWLRYMKHLKEDYPYLYSLGIRTNPFIKNSKGELD